MSALQASDHRSNAWDILTHGSGKCDKNYEKEHTKPLLNKHNLMTVHNLYLYHSSMDTFKTLKYRIQIFLYSLYLLSNRKEAFLFRAGD